MKLRKILNVVKKRNVLSYLIPVLIFIFCFTIYFLTINPSVSLYADAGEFPYVAFVNGFAHPPGYPLYVVFAKMFKLLSFGNLALATNLTSSFFGAVSITAFYLFVKHITKSSVSSFTASGILAFSSIFWINSVLSEVFTLVALLIILSYYFFLLWITTHKKKVLLSYSSYGWDCFLFSSNYYNSNFWTFHLVLRE